MSPEQRRFLINLARGAKAARNVADASDGMAGRTKRRHRGNPLSMQPVRSLPSTTRVSRNPITTSPLKRGGGRRRGCLSTGPPAVAAFVSSHPSCGPRRSATRRNNGLEAYITIDRGQRGGLGQSGGHVDNALYERIRPAHRVHDLQSVESALIASPGGGSGLLTGPWTRSRPYTCRRREGGQVPLSRSPSGCGTRPILINHLAQFPATTVILQT